MAECTWICEFRLDYSPATEYIYVVVVYWVDGEGELTNKYLSPGFIPIAHACFHINTKIRAAYFKRATFAAVLEYDDAIDDWWPLSLKSKFALRAMWQTQIFVRWFYYFKIESSIIEHSACDAHTSWVQRTARAICRRRHLALERHIFQMPCFTTRLGVGKLFGEIAIYLHAFIGWENNSKPYIQPIRMLCIPHIYVIRVRVVRAYHLMSHTYLCVLFIFLSTHFIISSMGKYPKSHPIIYCISAQCILTHRICLYELRSHYNKEKTIP